VFFAFLGAAAFFGLSGEVFFRGTEGLPRSGQLDPSSYSRMSLWFGAVMAIVILVSALGTHHRIPHLAGDPGHAEPFSRRRVAHELRGSLANRSFRLFFVAVLAFLVSRGVADGVALYMGTYFWRLATEDIFRVTLVGILGVLVGTPCWAVLGRRLEKKLMFLLGCGAFGMISMLAPVLKLAGWFPAEETPLYLPAIYGFSVLAALAGAGALVAPGSMLADVADEHELATGRRQEGVFFGAISFSGKAAAGLGGWLAGLALEAIRFPLRAEPDGVAAESVAQLGLLAGPGVFLVGAIGVGVLSFYDLDRRRHDAIRAALDARRAVA
jgi:Na+/melibiose symporter-like transporter